MRRNSGISFRPDHQEDRKIYFGAITENTSQVHATMEGDAGATEANNNLQQGTVLVKDVAANKVRAYVPGETLTPGTLELVGVLAQSVVWDEFFIVRENGTLVANDFQVTVLTGGEFVKSYLNGLDAQAETELGGVTSVRDINCCPGGESFKF